MPEQVDDCAKSVMEDNPDMSESRAYAICNAMNNRGELSHVREAAKIEADEDPCWEGYTMVGTKVDENGNEVPRCVPDEDVPDANMARSEESDCPDGQVSINGSCVPVESVGAPASLLSAPRIMASASPLDTQPIEREELSDGRVAYRGLKLIDSGVWTDSNSETATLYDERTFENTDPEYPREFDGPPVNIAHDLHKDGPKAGEPHEASIGGHIDPDSLATDGEALFGDVILNTDDAAGDFADENLRSALENDGTAGFSPSVELMPTELEDATHPRAEEYVAGAELTGLGLVRDPASKSVDLAHESRNRSVALASNNGDGGPKAKSLYLKDGAMSAKNLMDADELRETLDMYGFDGLDEMTDSEVMDMAEDLHGDLMADLEADGEESEMAEHGDYEDMDDEDEEDKDMADEDALGPINEQIDDLWDALDEIKEEMIDEEMMEDAKAELADADTVAEVDARLKTLENQSKESKTLADGREDDDGIDWSDADDGYDYDSATGSLSR